jgi:hypothetical protein
LDTGEHQVLIKQRVEAPHEFAELVHAEQGCDQLPLVARRPRGDAGEVVKAVLLDEAEAVFGFIWLDGLGLVFRPGR